MKQAISILCALSIGHLSYAQGTFQYPFYLLSRQVQARTTLVSGSYQLLDNSAGFVPTATLNCRGLSNVGDGVPITDNNNIWTNPELDKSQAHGTVTYLSPALDAHWGLQKALDYWKQKQQRNSYDSVGTRITNFLYITPTGYDPSAPNSENAQFNRVNVNTSGSRPDAYTYGGILFFGLPTAPAISDIITMGHEFGHGVNSTCAVNNSIPTVNWYDKIYFYGESGALDEGLADIWGACLANYVNQTTNPTLNVNPWDGPRYPANPYSHNFPSYYLGRNWETNDGSGSIENAQATVYRHKNGAVLNFWFYLLTAGGNGTNQGVPVGQAPLSYCVTGQGFDISADIVYQALRHLRYKAQFIDLYNTTLAVTQKKYGAASAQMQAVRDAWYAVGVGPTRDSFTLNYTPWTCSTTSSTFTISGNGSTPAQVVNWTVTPSSGLVTTSARTGTSQLTVTRVSGASGTVTISATTVGSCSNQTFGPVTFVVGTPMPQVQTPDWTCTTGIGPVAVNIDNYDPSVTYTITATGNMVNSPPGISNYTDASNVTHWFFQLRSRQAGATGTVKVKAACSNGTSATTSFNVTTPVCSGRSTSRTAYPNPATELLALPEGATQAQLLNSKGQSMQRPDEAGKLDVRQLPVGLYNLQFYQDGKLVNQRIEVKH